MIVSKRIIVAALATSISLVVAGSLVFCNALDRRQRIDAKIEKAKSGITSLVKAGRDPSVPLSMLQRAKAAFDLQHVDDGEALVDSCLKAIGTVPAAPPAKPPVLPTYTAEESFTDLYGRPEKIAIDGYNDECMEPFVSVDGSVLYYNNNNDIKQPTHIHMARRSGKSTYKYVGLVPGTSSQAKDMAPTIDSLGAFYFTSTRTYDHDLNSIFVGTLINGSVSDVKPVSGDISPRIHGWINMDCGISSDGNEMYISRARFDIPPTIPRESDLILALKRNGRFQIDPLSNKILRNVNTSALEYAPEISEDGLELYFTRAGNRVVDGRPTGPALRIMVATRKAKTDPFELAKVIRSIEGFVEAPTLTQDLQELFFHKKDEKGRLCIYRANRTGK